MHRPIVLAVLLLLTLGLVGCDDADPPTIADDGLGATAEDVIADGTPEPTEAPTEAPTESSTPEDTAAGSEDPPTFEEVCAGREGEAFIEVLTPQPDSEVGDPFTVTGCGNTFEANYIWRVELPDGSVAADGFGTMTCGSGCVGEFEEEITVGATGDVTLVVYETSAQDGSEEHVVEVPLQIN